MTRHDIAIMTKNRANRKVRCFLRYFQLVCISSLFLLASPLTGLSQESSTNTQATEEIESISVEGKSVKELLIAAEEFVSDQRFELAFQVYSKILENPSLLEKVDLSKFHYNLGVNAAKAKKVGLSIAYFNKTLYRSPLDWDARFNLDVMKTQANIRSGYGERYYTLPFLRPVLQNTPTGFFLVGTAVATLLILLSYAFLRNRWIMAIGIILFFPFGFLTTYSFIEGHDSVAIVISDTPVLRSGPSDSFPEILRIGEGSEVALIEKRKDWFKIEFALIANASEPIVGWLHQKDLLSVKE